MKLTQLFETEKEFEVEGLCIDSRKAKPGYMFFCLEGVETDGHKYVEVAIKKGAKVIVYENEINTDNEDVIYIKVEDTVEELNRVCNLFYDEPSHKLTMFGVTGTNGKSTITNIITQIYSEVRPCGYMGTISIDIGKVRKAPSLTTPDAITTHSNLKEMVDNGMEAATLEVSSHGLSMGRVDSVDFDYAVFTNLTHDHLDYHKTMENYLDAKAILFRNLKPNAVAALNADDKTFDTLARECGCKYVSYGIDNDADYMAEDIQFAENGTQFVLVHHDERYNVKTNLAAKYNVYNLLGAIAILTEAGMDMGVILEKARHINQIPGRMEYIDEGQPFRVIVDYAHTPDGFEKIFNYANHVVGEDGRVIGVFGAAGKRDKSKRKVFGQLASKYCNKVFLTEQDIRNEKPSHIADMIIKGMSPDTNYDYIENRKMAIEAAVRYADDNDIVVILGKGDEKFLYGIDGREPWIGDNNAAREAIKQRMYETCGHY